MVGNGNSLARSCLPNPARFGEISEMFVLREELCGFHQKSCLCEKEVDTV